MTRDRGGQRLGVGEGAVWFKALSQPGREVAGCLGLTPSPYASGESATEQGISKAGNRRVRTLMVELAWSCYATSRRAN